MGAIRLQFVSTKGFGSALIEWYSHGLYSHVDSILPDGRLLGARYGKDGAAAPGVQMRNPDYEVFNRKLAIELPTTDEIEVAYYGFLHEQIGKPYDMTAILGFVSGRDWMEGDSWYCSELVAAGLVESGGLHAMSAPANKITPSELLLVCSALIEIPRKIK